MSCFGTQRKSSRWLIGLFAIAFAFIPISALRAEDIPPEFETVSRDFVEYHWNQIVEYRDYLIDAYEITEDQKPAFLNLYYNAWVGYQHHLQRFAQTVSPDDTPDDSMRKAAEFADRSPISESNLADITESILDAGDHSESRHRFMELVNWGTNSRRDSVDTKIQGDEFIRLLNRIRAQFTSPVDDEGRPMPLDAYRQRYPRRQAVTQALGVILESPETCADPGFVRRLCDDCIERPTARPKPLVIGINTSKRGGNPDAPASAPLVLVARHEDDWRKKAMAMRDEIATANGFSPEQRKASESLLNEMFARADIVRRGNETAYLNLRALDSRREFSQKLAELDRPIEGLLLELKARLEAI